jgi:hypothetical protein
VVSALAASISAMRSAPSTSAANCREPTVPPPAARRTNPPGRGRQRSRYRGRRASVAARQRSAPPRGRRRGGTAGRSPSSTTTLTGSTSAASELLCDLAIARCRRTRPRASATRAEATAPGSLRDRAQFGKSVESIRQELLIRRRRSGNLMTSTPATASPTPSQSPDHQLPATPQRSTC